MAEDLDTAAGVREYLQGGADVAAKARASMVQASGSSPDIEAELRAVSARTGVPLSSARAFPDIARRRDVAATDFEGMAAKFPATLAFLSEQENARLAHDDVDALTGIEGALASVAKYIVSAPSARRGLATDLLAGVYGASEGAAGLMAAPFGLADQAIQAMDDAAAALTGTPRRRIAGTPGAESLLLSMGAAAREMQARLQPPTPSFLEASVSSGFSSLGQNLTALALGNPTAALTAMVGQVGGQSYGKAREKGVQAGQAALYGASDAAIEYATEKIPVGRLFGDLAAGTPLFSMLWRQAVAEVPGEQIATALQDLNEWAVLHPDKPFSAYLGERPSAALQTLIATLIGVGGNVTIMKAVEGTVAAADGGARRAQALADVMKAAAASKLRERDPQGFASLVDSAAQRAGAPAEVYLDARQVVDALQQAGVSLEQATAALPSLRDQLDDALATNGDVVLPLGEFAAGVAGSPFGQTLLQHVRTAPDELSAAELQRNDAEASLQKVADREAARAQEQQADTASRDAVRQTIFDELKKAGRFTDDVNAAYAEMTAQFFATVGARTGQTAEQLYARYPLKVRAAGTFGDALQQRQAPKPVIEPSTGLPTPETSGLPAAALGRYRVDFAEAKRLRAAAAQMAGVPGIAAKYNQMADALVESAQTAINDARAPLKQAGVARKQDQTETEAFKKWFGDSKVVDAEGKPLVVYHGTDADFSAFDRARTGKGPSKLGFWFTDMPDFAENFGGTLMPTYVSLQNPKMLTAAQWDRYRMQHGGDAAFFGALRDKFLAEGHDGVMVPGGVDKVGSMSIRTPAVVAAFNPEQIKSAIGNSGAFDPNDPSILKQTETPREVVDLRKREKVLQRLLECLT